MLNYLFYLVAHSVYYVKVYTENISCFKVHKYLSSIIIFSIYIYYL